MKNTSETLRKRNALKRMWMKKINHQSFPHFKTKICKECGKLKSCQWQHSFTQTGIPEYRARCVDCQKKYFHRVRTTNDYRSWRNKRRNSEMLVRKRKMVQYLGGKCSKCGYSKSLSALTFHHSNPKEKEFSLGKIKDHNWRKIKKELDKCVLLCFNCHMELHGEIENV